MESGDDGLESEANVRPRPRLTGAGQPRGCPAARWTAIDRGLSRDPLAQARLNRSAKGAGTGHSPRYPKSGTTQSDRLLGPRYRRVSYASGVFYLGDASEVVDEFLVPSLRPAAPPTPASPLVPKAASPR